VLGEGSHFTIFIPSAIVSIAAASGFAKVEL
jgi:hypothetical protein